MSRITMLVVLWSWYTLVDCALNISTHPFCTDNSKRSMNLVLRSRRSISGSWSTKVRLEHDQFLVRSDHPVHVSVSHNLTALKDRVLIVADIVAPAIWKDEDYTVGMYKLHTWHSTWMEAKRICEREGGHLAVVNSDLEAANLSKMLDHDASELMREAYVGVSDLGTEGNFVTVLGNALEDAGYIKWEEGRPQKSSYEDCVTLNSIGRMNDVPCEKRLPFFCEKVEVETTNTASDPRH